MAVRLRSPWEPVAPLPDQNNPAETHCCVCHDSSTDSQILGHWDGNKIVHRVHEICLQQWYQLNPTCPQCRRPENEPPLSLHTVARAVWEHAKLYRWSACFIPVHVLAGFTGRNALDFSMSRLAHYTFGALLGTVFSSIALGVFQDSLLFAGRKWIAPHLSRYPRMQALLPVALFALSSVAVIWMFASGAQLLVALHTRFLTEQGVQAAKQLLSSPHSMQKFRALLDATPSLNALIYQAIGFSLAVTGPLHFSWSMKLCLQHDHKPIDGIAIR